MSIEKKLLGTTPVSGAVDPEGVSFDGTNDYLSRSSDLSGNADGKTFTFSAWVYWTTDGEGTVYTNKKGFQLLLDTGGNNEFHLWGYNSVGTTILDIKIADASFNHHPQQNTWTHILISVDLSNTSNRYVYFNDISIGTTWLTYTNDNIAFTKTPHGVGSYVNTITGTHDTNYKGRLAHVFLDYTYRDLSVTANRRLFIDSDGKPSSTIPSSPILYLPMTDAATAGSNSGTGGDFTVNGVLDTAGRGANQWNCSASTFDGVNDYLSRSSITGLAGGKVFTFSCNFKFTTSDAEPFLEFGTTGGDTHFRMTHQSGVRPYIYLRAHNSSGTQILSYQIYADRFARGTHHSLQASIDLSDTSKRSVYLDGIAQTNTYAIYTNDTIDFNSGRYRVGRTSYGSTYNFDGSIGELYFDTNYTDLSTDNPFWDADANRPKPVRQVIEETGTTPLIALPLRGDDAGNNLGTGGDFTVNSGPYTGARGGSEYWARSAEFDGSTGYLSRGSTVPNSSTFTCAIAVKFDSTSGVKGILETASSSPGGQYGLRIQQDDAKWEIQLKNTSTSVVGNYNRDMSAGVWYIILSSYDSGTPKWTTYDTVSGTVNTVTSFINSGSIKLGYDTRIGGGQTAAVGYHNGMIGSVFLSTEYIDFSQESNRNLFVDQLGYLKDLTPAIDDGTIADPQLYMKFDDTSALGTNSGTGGNFTVNGTVTDGADVDPNA